MCSLFASCIFIWTNKDDDDDDDDDDDVGPANDDVSNHKDKYITFQSHISLRFYYYVLQILVLLCVLSN